MQSINDLPNATRKRLVQLEELLKSWSGEKITSAKICELTGWKDSLVRHDLWLIKSTVVEPVETTAEHGDFRGWKNGYNTADLLAAVQSINKSETQNVCIAGLGRLGAALLDNSLFDGSHFVIKAGFDSNVNRVEILRSTFPLYPASDMNWVIKQEKITLAILAVADKDAQSMCDRLVKAGIKGIVNMTRMVLSVPEGIKIENLSVLNALKMIT
ncbi:redox-sensing transcriptional repressor [Treponema bryantii]|uniref:Redox-sensing transcriptional repressor n=1 Tax=Treponema bryantii TaxID=163 RepID=A0A1I3KPK0_9SPIR|nr:hypothetical protein [Treponema bryantii]SFI74367.1 redox-sensing transcriptional repressor [Treponema bryantii]